MTKEELFANAKEAVFGPAPSCKMACIGRNMAVSYFGPIIEDAEAVLLDMRVPHIGFETALQNAFTFANDAVLKPFPAQAREAVQACADNFRARYEPLLKELEFKAA